MSYRRTGLLFLGIFFSLLNLQAQIGDKSDKPGEVQQLIVPRELIPPTTPHTPEEERQTFQIAPGYRVELVAADPLVQDPVAMTIDPKGRIWVVEMRGFMPDLDGTGEDLPVGRVSILEDTNGDGKMDKSTVFLDHLILPRAICLVGDGALIGAPPKLWYCRDTNGDGKCDEQIEVANDFGIMVDPKRPELANPERAPNAPLYALDNWIYCGAYTGRFRFHNGQWERGTTTFRGQWGLSQDDFGRLFSNSNSDQLRVDIIHSQYLGRNPNYFRPLGANVNAVPNQLVWPVRVNPGINRGYRPEMLRNGRLKEFTAACAPYIYRGDLFPADAYGNAFVCEPAGNLIKRNILVETNGTVMAHEAYDQREFLASTDERFRPVNLYTGPEGALYVVDLYRGVLQHRISLTSYLRKQSEERGLVQPVHYGRLWRIVPDGKSSPAVKPGFASEKPTDWVKHLDHANAWWRETAQRLLVERADLSVVPALQEMALHGSSSLGRMHAIWTLAGVNQLDSRTARAAFRDADPRVRVAAIRACEPLLSSEDKDEVIDGLVALSQDPAPQVRLQLVLTLGEAHHPAADQLLTLMACKSPQDVFLRDAAITGLYGRESATMDFLLTREPSLAADANTDKFLTALARCVVASRKANEIEQLLNRITEQTSAKRQLALLDGAVMATGGMKKPLRFSEEPSVLAKLAQLPGGAIKTRVTKLSASIVWPGKPGVPPEPVIPPLSPEQQARFAEGKALFLSTCAACHQPHGLGMDGLAPPLVDSEWVLGSEQRLIRIALNGVSGPLKVKGATYALDMPSMGVFDDHQLACILTYLRREWENGAAPVAPETVQAVRKSISGRQDAWRQEELLRVP